MPMKNPPHPGQTVRHDCLEPLGITATEGARALGVGRKAVADRVNGQARSSPERSILLSKACGSRPEVWARIQLDYDMAEALKVADRIKVQRVASRHEEEPLPG